MSRSWPDGVDRIVIEGIRAHGYHGVLAGERQTGQEFIVDVVIGIDVHKAAAADDLSLTIDYSTVAQQVVAIVEGEPVNLIETLAENIATAVLERARVRGVEVTVHKPEAPIAVPFGDVAVSIARWR